MVRVSLGTNTLVSNQSLLTRTAIVGV